MDEIFYIKKFIRDDGSQLAFDKNEIYLDTDNTLLVRPDPETTAVNYTEANGAEMVRQQTHTSIQDVNGLIVPKTTPYWNLVTNLTSFFQINHTYKIVYIQKDGKMFAVDGAWISAALQVPPRPQEEYSRWTVSLEIGREAWREYAEDSDGKEIYSNSVNLPLISAASGGEKWDTVGLVADSVGEEWEGGEGGVQEVYIASSQRIYPVWVVEGECINPTLQNNTTDTVAQYTGTVAEGQTLVVDFESGEARLDGALVTRNITGFVSFNPGANMVGFNSDGGDTSTSEIQWNNTIG